MADDSRENTPETRRRAHLRIRLLTRSTVVAATGATALIGILVAKEHPGASATSQAKKTDPASSTATTTTTTTAPSSGGRVTTQTTTTHPTTTTTQPVVTSGGTSR